LSPSPSITPPSVRSGWFAALAATLLGGLAAGALWCVVALGTDVDTSALIVPLGIGLATFLRWQGFRGSRGAACAALATLLAFAYAQYLFAAAKVAQMLGFPLRSTLFTMDFGMGWQVARANMGAWDIGWLLMALVIAMMLMLRPLRVAK
jgi:hypothetical protein